MSKTIILAYSGGLDTSFCVKYLTVEKGFEVHAVTVDTGGFSAEELADMEKRAYALGAKTFHRVDAVKQYYEQCLRYLVFGNVLRNQTYPLSVSAERMFQALAIVEYAKKTGAKYVAHGSTGAGNDQVRFDIVFNILGEGLQVITPIRDLRWSRQQEVDYLAKHGVGWSQQKATYSVNKGIWGTSVGGKETLTSDQALPESAYPTQLTATGFQDVSLQFEKGELTGVDGKIYPHPVDAIVALEQLAKPYAIGRDIHVGDTIIGIKGRVGFEAPSALITIKAHHLLEKHTLTKWQAYWKDQLANWYGMLLHEGQFLDPVMRNIETFLTDTQQRVSGRVMLRLMPYRFELQGIESPFDLMQSSFGQYGEMNKAWTGDDVKGFTKILGNQSMIFHSLATKEVEP